MPLYFILLIIRLLACACEQGVCSSNHSNRPSNEAQRSIPYEMGGCEIGSLALGIISSMILACFLLLNIVLVMAQGTIVGGPVGVVSLSIKLLASVLLCNGIIKRRPGQVLFYFLYGVALLVVILTFAILVQAKYNDEATEFITNFPFACIYTFIGCALYAPCLYMVYRAYSKIRKAKASEDLIVLVSE